VNPTIDAAAFAPQALRRASPTLDRKWIERRREPAATASLNAFRAFDVDRGGARR
jgi:hypothetical protein